ncbi:hypothetical protein BDV26DRAFT_291387 [Aspergillus bertholletiae]|uniref:Uncharacterized protein n=1 Tax=Aspergillus bertholletiae TaxID=1226010 RepID=A0A5N7BC65_9EURO|nr:hypothetical protein BDV26DRAFT_291387 [Aspergillus bertholletiae]
MSSAATSSADASFCCLMGSSQSLAGLDIYSWDIDITLRRYSQDPIKQQWPGKIRLIAFADVFFLISYSANARFEKGIVIYKDDHDVNTLLGGDHPLITESHRLPNASDDNLSLESPGKSPLVSVGPQTEDNDGPPTKPLTEKAKDEVKKRFNFVNGGKYSAKGYGHEIGLRYTYRRDELAEYTIEINKPYHRGTRRSIQRGLEEHSILQLLGDDLRSGIIKQGQMTGHLLSKYLANGMLDDVLKKYVDGVASTDRSGSMTV